MTVTADELLRMPDNLYELVEGELRTKSPGGANHGRGLIDDIFTTVR